MKLTALMPARNEEWVIGLSARVALSWCDSLVILNHASTDRTADIIGELQAEYPTRVFAISVPVAQWDEMEHRQFLLERARALGGDLGATHIALIDADEILTGNISPNVREMVEQTPPCSMLQLPLYNLRGNIHRYHADGIWGNRIVSLAFRDHSAARWAGNTFHHREPHGIAWNPFRPLKQGQGGVLHLWGCSERRLLAKHRLYKITERLRFPDKDIAVIDKMYSLAIHGNLPHDPADKWTYKPVPDAWWTPYEDVGQEHLHPNMKPWQEAEARRLIDEHGAAKFAGLDLFWGSMESSNTLLAVNNNTWGHSDESGVTRRPT